MSKTYLAQTPNPNFQQILQQALPGYQPPQPGKGINLLDPNLTIGNLITAVIPYIFVIAGLIFFGLLIWAGFEFLTSAGDPEKVKGAQGKLTGAITGFIIIFAAYWIAQILEVIFGITILG